MINYILHGANIIVGILILFLGYNIKFKNKVQFVRKYEPEKLKDEDSYSNCVGIIKMIMGLVFILLGISGFIIFNDIAMIMILDIIFILIFLVLLFWSYKRYKL